MAPILRALPYALSVLLFAALTHFVAVLILPKVATRDAYSRLIATGDSTRMVMLPATAPGNTLVPFQDPAVVQGVCFFDVEKAPVRVKTRIEEGRLLSLSFRSRDGRIFYAMTDRAALRDTIDIRLLTDSQLQQVETGDDEDQGPPSELRLKSPTSKGLVIATALILRPGDREDAEARLKAIDCRPEPLPAVR